MSRRRRLGATRSVSRAVVLLVTTLGSLACDSNTETSTSTTTSPLPTPAVTYTIQLIPDVIELIWSAVELESVVVKAIVRSSAGEVVSQPNIVWSTDFPWVETVTSPGIVTAVGVGSTTLHARYNTVVASAIITVTVPIGSST